MLSWPGPRAALLNRRWAQWLLLAGSVVIVLHGLLGPQLAPKNLATLLVWVHYRGLLMVALLAAGNLFCMACPFMAVRDLARRLHPPRLRWPRSLSGKAIGITLLVAALFAYELFDLWASPWATAWLVIGYFAAAALLDALFQGAPFCKSVCPIGQFNFVSSGLSPLEVRVRDADVCASCTGHECLRGSVTAATSPAPAHGERGCELGLFLPEKVGNMDCTFCLDCARACPEDNVALTARLPGDELFDLRSGAGVGRRTQRLDLAILTTVFTFGALLNAFGMVSPVYALMSWLADLLGTTSEAAVLGVLFVAFLVVEPVVLLGLTAALCRRAMPSTDGQRPGLVPVVLRFVHGLVPLGVGVWTAHYGFHLLTGLWTFVPITQKALVDLGLPVLGAPDWGMGGLRENVVLPIEMGLLFIGAVGSWGVLWRIACDAAPDRPRAVWWPWAALTFVLFLAAVWLLAQPMEMRGTFLGS